MSEVPDAQAVAAVSAGALLREARERAGMHIGALAVGLKVPVKKIEALEADRLDLLPDAVFARALASSIARTLKTDPAPILAALPQSQTPGLEVGGLGSRIRTDPPTRPAVGAVLSVLRKPAVLVGGLLVIGALALVFVPGSEAPSSGQALTSPALVSGLTAPAGSDSAVNPPKVASNEVSAVTQSLPAALPGSGKPSDSTMALGSGVEVQAKSGNTGLIRLNASGVTWVEVTDATGVVQLRKTLAAGENASAGGILPLKVVVGRIDVTQVQVHGKPFDMAPFGKDNVARFEVR